MDKQNIFIDDSSALTPTELRSRARRVYKENGGLSMIMIDYLQLMRVPELQDNRTLEIAENFSLTEGVGEGITSTGGGIVTT